MKRGSAVEENAPLMQRFERILASDEIAGHQKYTVVDNRGRKLLVDEEAFESIGDSHLVNKFKIHAAGQFHLREEEESHNQAVNPDHAPVKNESENNEVEDNTAASVLQTFTEQEQRRNTAQQSEGSLNHYQKSRSTSTHHVEDRQKSSQIPTELHQRDVLKFHLDRLKHEHTEKFNELKRQQDDERKDFQKIPRSGLELTAHFKQQAAVREKLQLQQAEEKELLEKSIFKSDVSDQPLHRNVSPSPIVQHSQIPESPSRPKSSTNSHQNDEPSSSPDLVVEEKILMPFYNLRSEAPPARMTKEQYKSLEECFNQVWRFAYLGRQHPIWDLEIRVLEDTDTGTPPPLSAYPPGEERDMRMDSDIDARRGAPSLLRNMNDWTSLNKIQKHLDEVLCCAQKGETHPSWFLGRPNAADVLKARRAIRDWHRDLLRDSRTYAFDDGNPPIRLMRDAWWERYGHCQKEEFNYKRMRRDIHLFRC